MTTELLHRLANGLPRFARNDSERVCARHDGDRGLARHDVETGVLRDDTQIPVTARSEATWQSMDCFVPRNDGDKGFARHDGDKGFARHDVDKGFARHDGDKGNDGEKGLARHDVETGVLRGDTQIPVTARSEATWQSMDGFVPRNDSGLER